MRGRTANGCRRGGRNCRQPARHTQHAAPCAVPRAHLARPGSPSLFSPANPSPCCPLPPALRNPPPPSGQQLVDMKAGDIYIIQYRLVQRLVQQDIAVLI